MVYLSQALTNQITREAMVKRGLKRIRDHVRLVPGEIASSRPTSRPSPRG